MSISISIISKYRQFKTTQQHCCVVMSSLTTDNVIKA